MVTTWPIKWLASANCKKKMFEETIVRLGLIEEQHPNICLCWRAGHHSSLHWVTLASDLNSEVLPVWSICWWFSCSSLCWFLSWEWLTRVASCYLWCLGQVISTIRISEKGREYVSFGGIYGQTSLFNNWSDATEGLKVQCVPVYPENLQILQPYNS
jgi:drug/metabolite transporter superfamily protein YnfA